MKLRFTGFDDKTSRFKNLFELTLEKGKIVVSNEEGVAFLNYLIALEKVGMGLEDSKLLAAGRYEDLFKFFVKHYNSPYLSAKELAGET